jgi:hypothetical protein
LTLLLETHASGAALAAERAVGILVGLVVVLGLWWWVRQR